MALLIVPLIVSDGASSTKSDVIPLQQALISQVKEKEF